MKQQDKELLLKDLSARFPYGVKIAWPLWNGTDINAIVSPKGKPIVRVKDELTLTISNFNPENPQKPYLRPMSSMTDEEKKEYLYITERWMYDPTYSIADSIDWLNAHHFDYRGLIDKGLALKAPEGLYNIENK